MNAPIPSDSCLDSPHNSGRTIRLRAARALSENSYPHNDWDSRPWPYDRQWSCEACAILSESLRLLASLENVP